MALLAVAATAIIYLVLHRPPAGRPVAAVAEPGPAASQAAAPAVAVAPLRPRPQPTNLVAAAAAIAPAHGNSVARSNLVHRFEKMDIHFTPEQLADYFRRKGTNAQTLLVAAQVGTNRMEYLKLAGTLFPNDPHVQFAVLGFNAFPQERREWLDRFKQSAPDNSLPAYLSAREYLAAGDRAGAMQELAAAASRPHFNDYTVDAWQATEEALLGADKSVVDAKGGAAIAVLLPHLPMLRTLSGDLETMQKEYVAAGDSASAEALARIGYSMGSQVLDGEGSHFVINQLVGVAIEKRLLGQLPPDAQPDFLGKSVQDRLTELDAFRQSVKTLNSQWVELLERADDAEIIAYFDRMKMQGEYATLQWLHQQRAAAQ